jgi:hypothetical protein
METIISLLCVSVASLAAMNAVHWYCDSKRWNILISWMEKHDRKLDEQLAPDLIPDVHKLGAKTRSLSQKANTEERRLHNQFFDARMIEMHIAKAELLND